MTSMKTGLTIAGSDCSGGAGIQADIKTMTTNGVYAMSAITALTAQNTTGVRDILEVSPQFLKEQLDCIFTDIRPDAVKIGMVSSTELIEVIAGALRQYEAVHIVVDPVMVATSGARLIREEAICAMQEKLFKIAEANDLLWKKDGAMRWFYGTRIENSNTHGTGCTLSSAIAANLAKEFELEESVKRAKQYLSDALEFKLDLGAGSGPMNHAFAWNRKE